MKFLHLADLHLGKEVNKFSMIEDQKYALKQVLGCFAQDDLDMLLIAGDVYDKSVPSTEAVSLLDWFFAELSQFKKPVLVIPGNHDSSEKLAYGAGIFEKHNILIAKPFSGTIQYFDFEDEFGPLRAWMFPFVRPGEVRQYFPDVEIKSTEDAFKVLLSSCDIDTNQRNIALVHQFVAGTGLPKTSDSETSYVGATDAISYELFNDFEYVAVGHIHRSQAMGRPCVRYSGSLLKYSFSEAKYDKKFPVVELKAKGDEVSVDLVSFKPLHDMREIRATVEALLSDEVLGVADPCDYVHITLTNEDEVAPLEVKKLREAYPNCMQLDYDNSRTRAEGISSGDFAQVKQKTPEELFDDFFRKQAGRDMSDYQKKLIHSLISEG